MAGFDSLIALAEGARSEEGVGVLELHGLLVEARNDPQRPALGDLLGVLDGAITVARSLPACPPQALPEVRHHLVELVKVLARAADGQYAPVVEEEPEGFEVVPEDTDAEAAEESARVYREIEQENALVLGEILVQLGLISGEEVALALNAQDTTGKRLGEVLTETGMIGLGDLKTALNLQQHLTKSTLVEAKSGRLIDEWHLGSILLRSGVIDQATLDRALDLQARSGLRIGEALVELTAVTWDQISEAVRFQSQERRRRA